MRRSGWVLVLGSALVFLAACGSEAPARRNAAAAPVTVTTTVVQSAPWTDSIAALGTVQANESVTITAKVSETVDKVQFDSGDYVRAGDVLVLLSDRAELAGLNEASASYREAQKSLERQELMANRQLIAASQLDIQRAARDAARARMDQVRAELADRAVVAPFDGVLGLRRISPGALITPGMVITTLDDISRVKLDFSLPERYLPLLAKEQIVLARSTAYPDEEFEGVVKSLDSRVDPAMRSFTARAEIANIERKLRPGMLMAVRILQPPRQTLTVPEIAVIQVARQSFVFRAQDDGGVEQVPVQLGQREAGRVEVLAGLQAGDRIVVDGTVKLRPGSQIVESAGMVEAAASSGKDTAGATPGRD